MWKVVVVDVFTVMGYDIYIEVQTKTTPQRPKQETPQQHQQANEDNDDDYDYNRVSGRASIGLAGGRSMRSPSPLVTVYEY